MCSLIITNYSQKVSLHNIFFFLCGSSQNKDAGIKLNKILRESQSLNTANQIYVEKSCWCRKPVTDCLSDTLAQIMSHSAKGDDLDVIDCRLYTAFNVLLF